jgi:hypothetical protein
MVEIIASDDCEHLYVICMPYNKMRFLHSGHFILQDAQLLPTPARPFLGGKCFELATSELAQPHYVWM